MASITSGTPWPRFRSESRDQSRHHHAADDRRQNDESAPRPGGCEDIGIVVKRQRAEKEQIVDHGNQAAKENRAEAGDQPGDQRQH
jgi:hypothetical protein